MFYNLREAGSLTNIFNADLIASRIQFACAISDREFTVTRTIAGRRTFP
jgi:hypothetical protein